ncbi:hypothetical protein [Kitasatospora sp. NPDC057015]|uniref:hypothetical protein n=1 Tax=Kitasatospora sp. NPDC057015 TaxID=3346001 RepID=UPI0036271923
MPFAFTADDRRQYAVERAYPGNVAPPRRERVSARVVCGRVAIGLLLVSGLVAAVALGTPALSARGSDPGDRPGAQPAPVHGRP